MAVTTLTRNIMTTMVTVRTPQWYIELTWITQGISVNNPPQDYLANRNCGVFKILCLGTLWWKSTTRSRWTELVWFHPKRGSSSVGRAWPCQGQGRWFEPSLPLKCEYRIMVITPSFQVGDVGSIPAIRSKKKKRKIKVNLVISILFRIFIPY